MKVSQKTAAQLKNKYGDWVLITGATSGIGKELAIKFAEAGFKLVITGRRENVLNELSTALFDQYKTECFPVVGDLTKMDDVMQLLWEIDHLSIGIAILNAGFGTSGAFKDAELENELNMIDINIKSVAAMAHYFTKKMSFQPKRGAVVFLSSMVAFQGVPNAANYAATKAYVQTLGEALAVEMKDKGVDILCAAPGPVSSGFGDRANMKMGKSLSPEDVGVPIINAIGRRTTILPGFLTKFLVYLLRTSPRSLKVRIMGKVMGGFTKHQVA